MTELEKILIGAVVVGGTGLVIKIVYSWLSNGRRNGHIQKEQGRCIYHAELQADIKEQSVKIDKLTEDVGYIKGKLSILCRSIEDK